MARMRVEDAGGRLAAATVAAFWRFGRAARTAEVGGRAVGWRVADGGVEVTHLPADPAGPSQVYIVSVDKVATPSGGWRWWWTCDGCGRRAGELFLVAGRDRLGCRTCCNLAYTSQLTRERGRAKPKGRRVVVETERISWSAAPGWIKVRSTTRG